jgi:hypothetical protein
LATHEIPALVDIDADGLDIGYEYGGTQAPVCIDDGNSRYREVESVIR